MRRQREQAGCGTGTFEALSARRPHLAERLGLPSLPWVLLFVAGAALALFLVGAAAHGGFDVQLVARTPPRTMGAWERVSDDLRRGRGEHLTAAGAGPRSCRAPPPRWA